MSQLDRSSTPESDGTPPNVTLGTPLVCSCCGNGTFLPRDKFMNYRDIPNLMDASVQRGDAYGHGENSDRPTHGEIMWALSQPRNSLVRKLAEALDNTAVVQSENAPIPAGWKLVPIEPTEAMLEALGSSPWIVECDTKTVGHEVITTRREHREQRYVIDGWNAMLAAAPEAP